MAAKKRTEAKVEETSPAIDVSLVGHDVEHRLTDRVFHVLDVEGKQIGEIAIVTVPYAD